MNALSSSILALGFLSPAFAVAGLICAGLPILIHILNRRRYRTIDWAAMEFLLRALRKNRKRLRFEQLLLLATRCLVLAMLGFALARPLSCANSSLAGVGQTSALHVFIIDNSYSMAYEADRPDAKTHFEHAKHLAEQMIDRLSAGGESVAVITASRPAAAILERPTYDLQEARSIIERIPQSYGGTDLSEAIRLAIDIGHENARQTNKNLYLFTDATRSAWQTPASAGLKAQGAELANLFHITLFNLSQGPQWNQAVLDVHPAANLVTVKNNFGSDFIATVRGFGDGPDNSIQWRLDGNVLPGGQSLKLNLDTPPQTQSQAVIRSGGPHVISASLTEDDRLKIDNTRWRVVNVAAELKVLIVEGQRGIGPLGGSGAFLQLALAPPADTTGPAHSESYVDPQTISDLELGNRLLTDYRAVILCGVGQIQPAIADQMRQFVLGGGTLMIFMGEAVSSDNYNSVLLPRHLMPGPLTQRVSAGDEHPFLLDFNPNGPLHPLLSAFAHQEKSGLDTAEVFTYWRCEVPDDPQLRVLDFRRQDRATADPAIAAWALGEGHLIFVATTANADWTTLPAKPAYLALMHELLAGSVNPGDAWMNCLVGQKLTVPPTVKFTATPMLLDPQSQPIILSAAASADGNIGYETPPLATPGIYTLKTGTDSWPIAVNVPADEADVRTIDPSAMAAALGDIPITMGGDQLPAPAESPTAASDLGWSVMGFVLVFVGLECFLAMRFGHYRRR